MSYEPNMYANGKLCFTWFFLEKPPLLSFNRVLVFFFFLADWLYLAKPERLLNEKGVDGGSEK
jgi:hypothetical protein